MLNQDDRRRLNERLNRLERRNGFRLAAGIADYFAILLGIACILICAALIISLGNWLYNDFKSSFAILLHHLK